MAKKGVLDVMVRLLNVPTPTTAKQAAKAIANLAVNVENKKLISKAGGIPPLLVLAASEDVSVQVEAVAAIANLSVDDENERLIGQTLGGIRPILAAAGIADDDLQSQCARALRNLSCCKENQEVIRKCGGVEVLKTLLSTGNEKTKAQASKALANLEGGGGAESGVATG
jgi:hypothetical protein